jgi:hypothetical protein
MTASTQAFELAEIELGAVAVVRRDVVDDLGRPHQVDGKAPFAQRLARKLVAPKPSPLSVVVGATPSVAALAAALGMQGIDVAAAHGAGARIWD